MDPPADDRKLTLSNQPLAKSGAERLTRLLELCPLHEGSPTGFTVTLLVREGPYRCAYSTAGTSSFQTHSRNSMALEEIDLDLSNDEPPAEIRAIIDESDRRIDALFANHGNLRVPKYMPSDPELFFRVLEAITERDLPLGRVFCEWGCGFGVCACIAAKLGYEAYGIELDPKMAEEARSLTDDLGIPIEILETSYVPDGYDSYSGLGGEVLIKEERMRSRDDHFVSELIYDGMDREIAEIDVFFVYPWPLEQAFMRELFDEIAVEGAILIAFHKSGEILACRKIGEYGGPDMGAYEQ